MWLNTALSRVFYASVASIELSVLKRDELFAPYKVNASDASVRSFFFLVITTKKAALLGYFYIDYYKIQLNQYISVVSLYLAIAFKGFLIKHKSSILSEVKNPSISKLNIF
ncbi:hypothetical protein [Marinomonas arenicola]|uniref:Uncharacterized protein n=1 Tax=Marinomonas arenicola TaxID=569601 RepID=A0ABU9G102_9GAMM